MKESSSLRRKSTLYQRQEGVCGVSLTLIGQWMHLVGLSGRLGFALPSAAVPLDERELLHPRASVQFYIFAQAYCAEGVVVMVAVWRNGV